MKIYLVYCAALLVGVFHEKKAARRMVDRYQRRELPTKIDVVRLLH